MAESLVPSSGWSRLVVYVVYAKDGVVDDFVAYALERLRENADHLTVVANGEVDSRGRDLLRALGDTYLERPNEGFDIWGYKHAIDHHGEGLSAFDEVVLTNDTWYGPMHPFSDVFARMERSEVDFWGMTEHAAEPPTGASDGGVPRHLQSFWIAARRDLLGSEAWRRYWAELPSMPGYWDAVTLHELRFTDAMEEAGFTGGAAFPAADYPPGNTSILLPDLLLADGCPLLKRRVFHHYPPYLLRHATIGRWVLRAAASGDYPMELIFRNLARTTSPRVLNADAGLLEVLVADPSAPGPRESPALVVVGADDADTLDENLAALPPLDGDVHIVLAVPAALADRAERSLASLPFSPTVADIRVSSEPLGVLRVLATTRESGRSHGILLAVAAPRPSRARADHNGVAYVRRHAVESILGDGSQLRRALALFDREATLGVVLPPLPQIGSSVIVSADHEALGSVRATYGIAVPLDDGRQLAPLGGVFLARIEALALLVAAPASSDEVGIRDSLVAAAAAAGYHHRTVLSGRQTSISHTSLEYKVDELGASTWGYPLDQIQFLQRVAWRGIPNRRGIVARYLALNHPKLTPRLLSLRSRLRRRG